MRLDTAIEGVIVSSFVLAQIYLPGQVAWISRHLPGVAFEAWQLVLPADIML